MTIDELLCKFQGKCWHEWEYNEYWEDPVMGDVFRKCKLCGEKLIHPQGSTNPFDFLRPDFSDDHTAMELLRWFQREKKNMYDWFCAWMLRENPKAPVGINNQLIYINQQIEADSKSYMRWVVLLAEWLRLEETREKWGWEECPDKNIIGGLCITKKDSKCPVKEGDNCSGKIRAEWAREEG